MKGTGIWAHDATTTISYNLLLNRFFTLLHSQHPDLVSSGSKSYKIPPPQCLREGNKKVRHSRLPLIQPIANLSLDYLRQHLRNLQAYEAYR